MGGRKHAPLRADREMWIEEVSDSRLKRYERMIVSAVKDQRVDGSARRFPDYFRDLVQSEIGKRRGIS